MRRSQAERDLAPASESDSRDRGDHHPRDRRNRVERRDEVATDDRCLEGPPELGDVCARREDPITSRDDNRAGRVGVQLVGRRLQLGEQSGQQRVDLRVVERHDGDTVVTPFDVDQFGFVGHAAGE